MNIQSTELPKEAMAQAVDVDRVSRAVVQLEEKQHRANSTEEGAQQDTQEQQKDAPSLNREGAEKILKKAQDYFSNKGVDLNFKLVEGEDKLQVEVLDAKSHKVIRKIPEDEILSLSDNLKKMAKGVLDKAV